MLHQGIPAILLSFVCLALLPSRPEATHYLTEDERTIAIDRMNRSSSGDVGANVNKEHIRAAFKDWRVSLVYASHCTDSDVHFSSFLRFT
jgi:hypothetical protein